MNYILLCEGFNDWCESNYLPPLSRLLWFDLIHIFNRRGWSEWVQVSNRRLMDGLQLTREQTFISIRDKLIEKDLFLYEKGKKGQPSKYKLNADIEFIHAAQGVVKSVVKSVVYPVVKNVVKSEVQTVDIIKQKLKQKQKLKYKEKSPNGDKKKDAYGDFKNVFLFECELENLKSRFNDWGNRIELLSGYIASTGKKYKSHYATILNWSRKENNGESHRYSQQLNTKKLCTDYDEG